MQTLMQTMHNCHMLDTVNAIEQNNVDQAALIFRHLRRNKLDNTLPQELVSGESTEISANLLQKHSRSCFAINLQGYPLKQQDSRNRVKWHCVMTVLRARARYEFTRPLHQQSSLPQRGHLTAARMQRSYKETPKQTHLSPLSHALKDESRVGCLHCCIHRESSEPLLKCQLFSILNNRVHTNIHMLGQF